MVGAVLRSRSRGVRRSDLWNASQATRRGQSSGSQMTSSGTSHPRDRRKGGGGAGGNGGFPSANSKGSRRAGQGKVAAAAASTLLNRRLRVSILIVVLS